MKKLLVFIIACLFMLSTIPAVNAKMAKSTTVKGYTKKNGKYVHSYTAKKHYNTSSSYKKKKK